MQPDRSALVAEPHRRPALPDWRASVWLNTSAPPTPASLRGCTVLLHTFQMLCPGCVLHGLPQAERVWRAFPGARLAFVNEYGWSFPIGSQLAESNALGTPSCLHR